MIDQIYKYINSSTKFCVATLVNVSGSAPQNQGAKIIVLEDGKFEGTVGGGKVEAHVLSYAKELLKSETKTTTFETWNLQTEIGMTCGGKVSFFFETFNHASWDIVIFGAGHVCQQLVRTLSNLKCNIRVVDNRVEWLEKLPKLENVESIYKETMSDFVDELSKNSFTVVMTQGHSSDLPILSRILKLKSKLPYLGVIGSKSKRNSLEKGLRENDIQEFDFICPMGLPIGNNSPEEISISITAQLLEIKDKFFED
jgi:xanthine dehydrogenase accessory factor